MKKNTKRLILTNIIAIIGILSFALPAFAATSVSLAPQNLNVKPGQKFSVAVSVNPNGTANFVEKIEVKFPADLLEVDTFTLGSNWMAMTQSGYDSVDNTNGIMIKTAGYPAGITTLTNFGAVTFTAKKAGNGKITIGNSSLAFSASSQSAITGNTASFSIVAPAVVIKKSVTEGVVSTNKDVTESIPTDDVSVIEKTQTENTTNVAAVNRAIPTNTGNSWIWILAIIILAIIVYVVFVSLKKKQNKI